MTVEPASAPTTVVVIGAGAAGVSAARELAAAGPAVTVLEARNRLGGRTHTDYDLASHPVELGAEFIHGESVATWDWVRAFDAPTTGDAHAYDNRFHRGGQLLDRDAYHEAAGVEVYGAVARLAREWIDGGRDDASLDRLLEGWEQRFGAPLGDEERAMVANMTAQGASADLEQLGIYRSTESTFEGDGRLRHWRLLDGYAHLMRNAAAGLHVRLRTPVTRIRWDDSSVEITTPGGPPERYDRAVVTLPLGVLQRGDIEFDPPLPGSKRDAIDRLVPGHINKVVLRLDRVRWPPDMTFLFTPLDTQLWWRPGQGQPHEDPVVTAFFGGADAAAYEQMSEREAIEEAARQLGDILGEPLHAAVEAGRFIAWGAEPYTLMGYSGMPPHGLGLRAALGAPAGALHFAGEATNPIRPSTVHGAIESGRRAAAEILGGR